MTDLVLDLAAHDVLVDAKSFACASLTWPEHLVAAQFSIPFVVALSTATERTSLADFDQTGKVPEPVKTLFARVHVQAHDGAPERDRIAFTYRSGAVHEESAAGVRLGHPTNPIPREQTGEKLRDCISFAGTPWSAEHVEAVLSAALGIAELPSTNELTSLLRI
jgi:2-methylcitrate dehydratase PrpD